MKKIIIYLILSIISLSFVGISYSEDSNSTDDKKDKKLEEQTKNNSDLPYKVHCDCEHIAAVFEDTTKLTAGDSCGELTTDLTQRDLGSIGVNCKDNNCTCFFSHSVFAVGNDRDSAIENAKKTCEAVSQLTGKKFEITSPGTCKDEQ